MNSMLKLIKFLFVVGFAGLATLACTNDDSSTDRLFENSGIEGQVLRGPIHGGPVREGEVSEAGFSALFYVYKDDGKLLTSFHSDEAGFFHAALPPDSYKIIPDASAPLMNAEQQVQLVIVKKDNFTNATLHFDTGLR